MRKGIRAKYYMPFVSNSIKRNMAYKGAFFIRLISRFFTVLVTFYLWKAIYASSHSSIIRGFTFTEMTEYISMTFLTGIMSGINGFLASSIANDVVDGTIAIHLIRPIEYKYIKLSENIGEMCVNVLTQFFPFTVLLCIMGFIKIPDISSVILYIISLIIGYLCLFYFNFLFGLFSFHTTYFFGLNMAMTVIMQFFSGSIIPFSFLPESLERLFLFLPFSSVNYAPIMIFMGKISEMEIVNIILLQIFWMLIFALFGKIMWKLAIKRLTILGG